jgi:phage terminase large subunit GpA-like protein
MMDAVNDPAVEEIVGMCSAQVGKTEIANNMVGYFMDQDPSPILLLQPTLEMAETYSKDRLAPMLRDTPCLQGKVRDARARDSGNTLLHKTFPGGHLTMAGANSPASLASRPIRIVICDEVDRYPVSAGAEGDPVDLARKRTTTFWNRKVILISTPTVTGMSRIEAAFDASDKRRFFVPCFQCGERQFLKWSQVIWEPGQPETARYKCEACGALWDDAERWRAVRQGEWRATAPFNGVAGFHIWEAYSSWVKLSSTVEAFLKSKDYPERLKTWVNTALGETWQEKGEAPEWGRLYERAEDYDLGTVPAGGLFLTAGVDVQADRVEMFVYAWGRGKTCWLVDLVVIPGRPSEQRVWRDLSMRVNATYPHASGGSVPIAGVAIDSGYATQDVYSWVREQGPGRVIAVKGLDHGAAIIGQPSAVDVSFRGTKIARGIKVWPINTFALKTELYGRLNLEKPTRESGDPYPDGYCHFPRVGEEFFRQITAEQLMTRTVKGYQRREWQKMRERNEALDGWVYARARASLIGLDRFDEAAWAALEAQLVNPPQPAPAAPAEVRQDAPSKRPWFGRGAGWFGN